MTVADTFPGMSTRRERLREGVEFLSGETYTAWNAPTEREFGGREFMEDPNLDDLYDEVRERFVAMASGWEQWRIRFLWKATGGSKAGKCSLASGLVKHFGKVDFVIWFAADQVYGRRFSEEQMAALMFHELMHVSEKPDKDGITSPAIRKHDCEVFADEIEGFGDWDQQVAMIHRAFVRRDRMAE